MKEDLRQRRADGKKRSGISGKDKARRIATLIRRNGDCCHWCGKGFCAEVNQPFSRSVDHLVSRKFGGTERLDNIVLAHRICNEKRSNPPLGRRRIASDDEEVPTMEAAAARSNDLDEARETLAAAPQMSVGVADQNTSLTSRPDR